MNFTNKNVKSIFGSSDAQNAWAEIETLGWKKINPLSSDGVTNMLIMLNAAKSSNLKVSGNINADDEIVLITLL